MAQMELVNIPSYITDPGYRYKMPALKLQTIGVGNGIRTKIINLIEIAKALKLPTNYPLRFIGYELGSCISESKLLVNGVHSLDRLYKVLDSFIRKYILCVNCDYPEITIKVKHDLVCGECKACGEMSLLDNQHKMASFIRRNPLKIDPDFEEETTDYAERRNQNRDRSRSTRTERDRNRQQEEGKAGSISKKERVRDTEEEKERTSQIYLKKGFRELAPNLIHQARCIYAKYEKYENLSNIDMEFLLLEIAEVVPRVYERRLSYILFNIIFDENIMNQIMRKMPILTFFYKGKKDYHIDILLNLEYITLENKLSVKIERFIPMILKCFYDSGLMTGEFLLNWEKGSYTSRLLIDYRYKRPVDERFKAASRETLEWLKSQKDIEGSNLNSI